MAVGRYLAGYGRGIVLLVMLLLTGCMDGPPTATPVLPSRTLLPAKTGGLGSSFAEWQQQHKLDEAVPPDPDGARYYDNRQYYVSFWPPGPPVHADARVYTLWYNWTAPGVSLDTARAAARVLLPADAQLRQTMPQPGVAGSVVELYQSATGASLYPAITPPRDPWTSQAPGTISVLYFHNPVISVNVRAGRSPGLIYPTALPR